jgi:hypothetical protein
VSLTGVGRAIREERAFFKLEVPMQILISFLFLILQLCVVGFIAWLMVTLLGFAPFIVDPIKAILKNVIYFVAFIVSMILVIWWIASLVGYASLPYPISPPFLRRP